MFYVCFSCSSHISIQKVSLKISQSLHIDVYFENLLECCLVRKGCLLYVAPHCWLPFQKDLLPINQVRDISTT